jgi:hypothetical protein
MSESARSLLVVSTDLPGATGTLLAKGKLGETVTVEQPECGARPHQSSGPVKIALGDLDKMVQSALGGFINQRRRSSTDPRS